MNIYVFCWNIYLEIVSNKLNVLVSRLFMENTVLTKRLGKLLFQLWKFIARTKIYLFIYLQVLNNYSIFFKLTCSKFLNFSLTWGVSPLYIVFISLVSLNVLSEICPKFPSKIAICPKFCPKFVRNPAFFVRKLRSENLMSEIKQCEIFWS